ncbi:MAG: dihydrolipoyl dehydrogenase [Gammaproteobacteria bacterium]
MNTAYDVIVIGAGPAGYVAAIRAAQHGLNVACIDKWKNYDGSASFGGTCLNAGCIPSKALLESSELYHRAAHEFATHGINVSAPTIDVAKMQERRAGIVKQFTGGIEGLFKANKVTGLKGSGKLTGAGQVEFVDHDGNAQTLTAQQVILAAGSIPTELPFMPFDEETIVDSWRAIEFDHVPKRIGVIGAGVIGLELGSVWSRLGSAVTILEAQEDFLFMADRQIARDAQRQFKAQGLDVRLGAKVKGAAKGDDGVTLTFEDKKGEQTIEVDKVIVAVGRRPYTEGLLGEGVSVAIDERGFVEVDDECRTSMPNVWAVGDLVRGPMLAHKGSEEGVAVADLIAGEVAEVNYDAIPSVIYTAPEIAWVGKTEEQLKAEGVAYKTGTFNFAANGRAKALEQASGVAKVIASSEDDQILGVHIVGPMAGELIAEAVLAMEFSASTEDIQRTIHAHPSLSEALHEAALAADKKAIHAINR